MKYLFAVMLLVLSSRSWISALPKGNPYYLAAIQGNGRSYYLVYHREFASNYHDSRLRCQSIPGGDLADIQNETTLDYLSDKITRPAFVKSFNGTMTECLAIYPGSIIAGKSYIECISVYLMKLFSAEKGVSCGDGFNLRNSGH